MSLESPLLEMHKAAGAELGEYFGTILPAQFASYESEYAALRDSVGLIDTNYRAFFTFSGPDRHRYLNAVLTSNVRDLAPGHGTIGLLLTPQGHILAEVETLALEGSILAISHATTRDRTFTTFDKFIIMDDVTLEDATDKAGSLSLIGPRTPELLAELGIAEAELKQMPPFAHRELVIKGFRVRMAMQRKIGASPVAALIAPREHLPGLWSELAARARALGGHPSGMNALNSLRIEAGVPWFGYDYGDKQIPHEAGLEQSHISYEKGCYTGQEIVERVRSRGHVNRHITLLRFEGKEPPALGTVLLSDGNDVGNVTSTAHSPRYNAPIGLGYLRREQSAPGTILDAYGLRAEVIAPATIVQ